eukprot:COSAG06_NODE_60409_length_271_cov_0.587209_1_plen_49_part_01
MSSSSERSTCTQRSSIEQSKYVSMSMCTHVSCLTVVAVVDDVVASIWGM